MHGKHHDDKAKIISFERESCGHGGVIPDPMIMTKNSKRLTGFSNDLRGMENKQFTYTGDSWNVGGGFWFIKIIFILATMKTFKS